MSVPWRHRLVLLAVLLPAAVVFCVGITWGLPSRRLDPFLFGSREVWTGEQIKALAGGRADGGSTGADVDRNPLTGRDKIITLNATDAQRAQILIRYRLYTYQPDEMITMMALASMRPGQGDFDPKLYQYGGLWIYPVGAMLKAASVARLITLRTDLTYYLDHPEEFGRFYVVARLYVVAWALVGLWAVFRLTLRLTDGCVLTAAAAAACCAVMPVVVNMAHEAKPHLPGAVLILLAVLVGCRYVETGLKRWWLAMACLCGAAFGMVFSALTAFAIMPAAEVLRHQTHLQRLGRMLGACAIGAFVYLLTNPYIAINWFTNPDVLRSNFGNSVAMYEIGRWTEGVRTAAALIAEGTSAPLAVLAVLSLLVAVFIPENAPRTPADQVGLPIRLLPHLVAGWLLLVPSLVIAVQFIGLAAGKPGEYGRFAILPDMALGVAAVTVIRRRNLPRRCLHAALGAVFVIALVPGVGYLSGFQKDSSVPTSRAITAMTLQALGDQGHRKIGVLAEPAPYCMPPFDLFNTELQLLPRTGVVPPAAAPSVLVTPAESELPSLLRRLYRPGLVAEYSLDPTPISWANKPFDILVRTAATEPSQ